MPKDPKFIKIPSRYIDRVIGNYNPVVIITTRNANGECNAAPFAMCMEVCHQPPLIAFGVGHTKDTYHNVVASGEFVVNVPGQDILRNLMVTAIRYPPETNELIEARLNELPGIKINVKRIKECKLHFECVLEWTKETGNHFLVVGRVVSATANKAVLTDDYRLKFEKIKPVHYVGRGTNTFLESGKLVTVERKPFEPQ